MDDVNVRLSGLVLPVGGSIPYSQNSNNFADGGGAMLVLACSPAPEEGRDPRRQQHLCLGAAYGSASMREGVGPRGYERHIRGRKEERAGAPPGSTG